MQDIADPETLLAQVTDGLRQLLVDRAISRPLMVGILTGGEWIAERLHASLGIEEPLATLDISFYRDDFSRIGVNPKVKPSRLPPNVEDRHIILVDDVMHTGRTIRAAMNELFDYGRPASIMLACLLERDGRELPIRPDIAGAQVRLDPDRHIKLTGPAPLAFEIR
jgi:pyrimidine operon attenuation protein/uracil phosphoribosyltransferase